MPSNSCRNWVAAEGWIFSSGLFDFHGVVGFGPQGKIQISLGNDLVILNIQDLTSANTRNETESITDDFGNKLLCRLIISQSDNNNQLENFGSMGFQNISVLRDKETYFGGKYPYLQKQKHGKLFCVIVICLAHILKSASSLFQWQMLSRDIFHYALWLCYKINRLWNHSKHS